MIIKEVPCPDCQVNVLFQIDPESQDVKNKPIFTLTRLHNEGTSVLQVSFDQNYSARRVRCFKLHETSETEISSSAQIESLLQDMINLNEVARILVAKFDILDISLAVSLAFLLFPNITKFDRLEEKVNFANNNLQFFTGRIRSSDHLKKMKENLKKVNGVIFLFRAESLTEKRQKLFLKILKQMDLAAFIVICPVGSTGFPNEQATIDRIIDQVSGLVFGVHSTARSIAFFPLSDDRPETILDLFSWILSRKALNR